MMRLTLALLLICSPAWAGDISGAARVVDGDTIEVSHVTIRLWGVDAPEMDTAKGREAKSFLEGYLLGRHVKCEPRGRDKYQRTVAMCFIHDTVDVAGAMVTRGYAVDWPRYSKGYYAK